jgi:hypothetical protein
VEATQPVSKPRSVSNSNGVKAANVPEWVQLGKPVENLEVQWEMGAGKRAMECEMFTEMIRKKIAGKGSGSKGCSGGEHVQTWTTVLTFYIS